MTQRGAESGHKCFCVCTAHTDSCRIKRRETTLIFGVHRCGSRPSAESIDARWRASRLYAPRDGSVKRALLPFGLWTLDFGVRSLVFVLNSQLFSFRTPVTQSSQTQDQRSKGKLGTTGHGESPSKTVERAPEKPARQSRRASLTNE
jgi:hypothetical protein